MEEETGRKKQAEAWEAALLVSAQNMGIPAHSSSVPVSSVGAAAAQHMGLIIKTEYIAKDGLPFKDKPALDGTNFGYLPKMATTSKGSIGSLLASSFCERINSQANQDYSCVRCSLFSDSNSVCLFACL